MDIKFWAFAIFASFLSYSFIGNTTLLVIFCNDRNIFLNRTFTHISLQLIISAFISYISQVAIVLPETLYENLLSEYKASYIYRIVIFTETFSFFAILVFTFLLALSRYVFFNLPRFNNIFAGIRMHFIAAFMWLLIAIITVPDIYFCMQEFSGTRLQWIRKCEKSSIRNGLKFLWSFIMFGLPIIIFILHMAIFNNLRRKRSTVIFGRTGEFQNIPCMTQIYKRTSITKLTSPYNETHKNEISILIQGAILCVVAEIEILSFKFLRKLSAALLNDKVVICMNILTNCLIICLSAIQPTVYFICNKQIRHYVTIELMSKIKNTMGMISVRQILSVLSAKLYCHFCQQ